MTRPAKGCPFLFQWVSSTSTHWPAYCASICSSEDTPWGNRVAFFFLAISCPLRLDYDRCRRVSILQKLDLATLPEYYRVLYIVYIILFNIEVGDALS